jgi:hypothetical protein
MDKPKAHPLMGCAFFHRKGKFEWIKRKKKRVRRVIFLGVIAMIVSLYIGNEFQDRNGTSYAPARYFETGTKLVSF